MRRSALPLLALTLALASPDFACGGSQKRFEGGVYSQGNVRFRLTAPVPSGWREVELEGASLAWRDDVHAASILVNARCGDRDDDTPLVALTHHLVIGTTERVFDLEETVPFDGREARHTRLRAKLDGVPLAYDIYVAKKNGCVYDLVYVAPPDRIEAGVDDFQRFVAGFRAEGNGL